MLKLQPLSLEFYTRSAQAVAKDLIGKLFTRKYHGQILIGRIVETEAYLSDDPASHSYRGMTKRNSSMFRRGGCLYVYFTYGMHFCANVVTGKEGTGEAVLIRALEPIEGLTFIQKQRESSSGKKIRSLTQCLNGPAKICQAFNIHLSHDGLTLMQFPFMIAKGTRVNPMHIGRSQRIGIRNGKELRLRYFLRGSPWLSRR